MKGDTDARHRTWSPWLVVPALLVAVIDQLTKAWAVSALDDRDIDIVWTLRLNLSFNTGMAFGRGEGLGPIIGVVALVVIVTLVLGLRREQRPLLDLPIGLIVGGAVGNVIDRIFRSPGWLRGAVVDFIDFQWFPIFNVADIGITVGGALLVVAMAVIGREERSEPAATSTTTATSESADVGSDGVDSPEDHA